MFMSEVGLLLSIVALACSTWNAGYRMGARWRDKHENDS